MGTSADFEGNFELKNVPVGRRSLQFSMVGYESYVLNELLVSSGHEAKLTIELSPKATELEKVVIKVRKDAPVNSMTTLSSRQFTVEETQRYAGGMNDPARLASSFAGVATPSVSSNGISVRGNSPNGLLWQIEGVEVPNPNHFANLTVMGGGLLTAISNQMMGNSDFYTGAFPAEYGNATSGVFDIKLRTGNPSKRQHTIQTGLLGVDFSTEGPFRQGGQSSYLMNYRYSTMALLAPLLPDNTGILKYQDLAFKTHFPTKKAGTFSFWGIGALDGQQMKAADSSEWKAHFDRDNSNTALYMFATGLSHQARIGKQTFLKSTLSATGNGLNHTERRLDYNLQEKPQSAVNNFTGKYAFQTVIQHQFSKKHTNRTGFKYSYLDYHIDIEKSPNEGLDPVTIANKRGATGLLSGYSHSMIQLTPKLKLNAGIHSHLFLLDNQFSIEPRIGIKYNLDASQSIAFAYGIHSRIEQLPVYFVEQNGKRPNENLDLMRSTHYVVAYHAKLTPYIRMSIEPYFQQLTHVPVAPAGYIATINMENEIFFNENLISDGTGRNIGIDLTLEKFLQNGFYYLLTASVFDSRYHAADGIERSTKFNKNYVFNILVGKEWAVGKSKNNIFSTNFRMNYMGGNRKEPIDRSSSLINNEIIYGENNEVKAYNQKFDDQPIASFTISYRINKANHASIWSLQVLNAFKTEEFDSDYYNLKTGEIDTKYTGIMIPNVSYKIEF
jgi:hypothetical protein